MTGQFGLRLGSGGSAADFTTGLANFDRLRAERLAKAQASMKRNNIAVALLFKPFNIRYATSAKPGSDSFDRQNYCLCFADHGPILFSHHANPMGDCPWIKPEQRRTAFHWVQQAAGRDATWETVKRFAASIKDEMKGKGLGAEKLGVDDIDEAGRRALVEAGIELVDVMPPMLEARAIKTRDEINLIHMAAVNADAAHYAIYEALKPGVRERDLRVAAHSVLIRAGSDPVGTDIRSGGSVGGASSDRVIQVGDVVTVDLVRCNYMGYHTCYYRNYIVGRKPTEKEKDMHKKCYERMYQAIDTIRPGMTTAETAKCWKPAREHGSESEEAVWCNDIGHGIGLSLYEYPVTNRLWSFKHPQTYEKGMVIAIEAQESDPLIGRLKLEEMLVVNETGVEIFTRMPVKDIMIASPITTAE